jgi:hypothetical protein
MDAHVPNLALLDHLRGRHDAHPGPPTPSARVARR